jgi:transcriptional regulator with XRE-family HTH domain
MYALEQRSVVSREMIARIEGGESCPTLFVVRRLVFGLGVPMGELLEGLEGLDDLGVSGVA